VSLVFALLLIGLSYKSVVDLGLKSKFFSSTASYSSNIQDMLVHGMTARLLGRFFDILPIVCLITLIFIVAYTIYCTITGTSHSLRISHYVNAKREAASLIVLRYSAIGTVAFVVPLLFWCFLLTIWYPFFIQQPLRYIVGGRMLQLTLMSFLVVIVLVVLTHLGIVFTRLGAKTFKHVIKG